MKAWTYQAYGSPDVLSLNDVDAPTPKAHEVAVRVQASGLNAADWHMMQGDPFLVHLAVGLRKPRHRMIIGSDAAGIVESVGSGVTRLVPGDRVYAESVFGGGCADVITVDEARAGRIPPRLTFEQAAAVPMAGLTALQAVRDYGDLQPGQSVLIIGASGGVGTFATQIARALGGKVTAVCHTAAAELVRSLGAIDVIDYTVEDPTATGRTYDVVVNIGGTHPLRDLRRALTRRGTLAAIGGSQHGGLLGPGSVGTRGRFLSPFVSQRLRSVSGKPNFADLDVLSRMIEREDVEPVLDRVYPFGDTPDAMRYLVEGHPKGKVVVTVASEAGASRS